MIITIIKIPAIVAAAVWGKVRQNRGLDQTIKYLRESEYLA